MTRTALPGTKFYAPQARLVDADTNQVIGGASGQHSTPDPADLDLVSANVTLEVNNVGQLKVVLNNQRFADGLPVFPPWKYNGLGQIRFGQRLRLDVRYGGDPWTKLILARVTDLQFSFPSAGAAQLTVIGEDLLSLLKIKPESDKRYNHHTEDFMVRDVLARSQAADLGLGFAGIQPTGNPLTGPLLAWRDLQPMRSVTHSKDTTYLQFLQDLAERLDHEVFVDFTERLVLDAKAPPTDVNKVVLHHEPARSLVDPQRPLVLGWGANLVDFTPKFKVWEQLTGVTFAGTKHGTRKRHTKSVEISSADIKADLKADPDYSIRASKGQSEPVELLNAGEVRERFFTKEGKPPPNSPKVDAVNLDEDRALLKGLAMLRKSMRELLTAHGSTFGIPELRPGIYVSIDGLYPPFDGYYYVTQTVHTFDTSGYRTQFNLRRPGMLDPQKYPAKEGTA